MARFLLSSLSVASSAASLDARTVGATTGWSWRLLTPRPGSREETGPAGEEADEGGANGDNVDEESSVASAPDEEDDANSEPMSDGVSPSPRSSRVPCESPSEEAVGHSATCGSTTGGVAAGARGGPGRPSQAPGPAHAWASVGRGSAAAGAGGSRCRGGRGGAAIAGAGAGGT